MPNRLSISRQAVEDLNGEPASGALAYHCRAGTDEPLQTWWSSTTDVGHQNPFPVVASSQGRFPSVYINYGEPYRERVVDRDGVVLWDDDYIPNIDPTPLPVPPVTQGLKTGDMIMAFDKDPIAGFVRANGKTISRAESPIGSGDELASDECHALYVLLWTNCGQDVCPVSGGRGSNAENDWGDGKRLTLPDLRGAVPCGVADMGNTNTGLLAHPANRIIQGSHIETASIMGGNDYYLTLLELAPHSHGVTGLHSVIAGSISTTLSGTANGQTADWVEGDHSHPVTYQKASPTNTPTNLSWSSGGSNIVTAVGDTPTTISADADGGFTHRHNITNVPVSVSGTLNITDGPTLSGNTTVTTTFTIDEAGGIAGTGLPRPHDCMQRSTLVSFYIKL